LVGMTHLSFLKTCFLVIALAALLMPAAASAESPQCVKQYENGAVNWSTGQVIVTGKAAPETNSEGVPMAMPGSARAHAARNIIAMLKQLRITPDLTVGEYASAHDVTLAGIEKTAQDAVIVRQLYTSALDVEVRVETKIFGGFLQLVLPDHIRQIPKIAEQKSKSMGKAGVSKSMETRLPYTGLVIDARGLTLDPILYPTIVSEEGRAVYSSLFISREYAVQYGVAAYVCDMSAALSSRRIGSNPMVFKALRKADSNTGAIVVSISDAKTLEKVTERHKFLKECRVIIVVDQ